MWGKKKNISEIIKENNNPCGAHLWLISINFNSQTLCHHLDLSTRQKTKTHGYNTLKELFFYVTALLICVQRIMRDIFTLSKASNKIKCFLVEVIYCASSYFYVHFSGKYNQNLL